jgi:hypothetical protein
MPLLAGVTLRGRAILTSNRVKMTRLSASVSGLSLARANYCGLFNSALGLSGVACAKLA